MIIDILGLFGKEYEAKGDKLILDSYELKEGLYTKVNTNDSFETFLVKKKNRELLFTDLENGLNWTAFEWFKERDYYSSYLNSNKAFNDKKIHNINYLSLFVKIESFISKDSKKLIEDDAIKNQYKYLCNYKKFNKPQEKEILATFKEQLRDRNRRRDIVKKYKWIRDNINSIVELAKENGIKNYIKIFFDEPIEKYKKESEIYYAIKIFNDISFSKNIDGKVFGLSDSNMGLNSKKPYLEHKTRKEKVPFMVLKENAILAKKFFDWLKFQNFIDKKPLGNDFFINRDFKEKDLIIDFDYLPIKINKLKKPIVIKNHLLLKKDKIFIEDEKIEYLNLLEDKIDEILYNRQLKNNYYGEVYKKLDNKFASLIYSTRDAMSGYFKKYDKRGFDTVIKKYATHLAIEHLKRSHFLQAGLCLNLKFSLLEEKGEAVMDIKAMQNNMIDRIKKGTEYKTLTNEEFFYLSGQVVKYLLQQSESYQKSGNMLESFLRLKNIKKLKEEIRFTFFKYKHKIGLNHIQFNNALALITAYDTNEKLDIDSFLVGLLSENIFYIKKEE